MKQIKGSKAQAPKPLEQLCNGFFEAHVRVELIYALSCQGKIY